jgi:DNA modification methylase
MKEKIKMTLIQGDCLKVLPTIPDESVDLVLTDPPFMISSDLVIKRNNLKKSKYKRASDISYQFGEWDYFENKEKYFEFTYNWLKECIRILRKGGALVTFFDKAKISYIWDFLEENGMKNRQILIWLKTNPTPRLRKVNFSTTSSFLVWSVKKGGKQTFNYKIGYQTDYIFSPIVMGKEREQHPTQKPEKVIETWMKYLSNEGDMILDPFLGSGTTMKVARDLKRSCIGIEINPKYIEICKKRLNWGSSLSNNIEWEFKIF